MRAHLIRMSQYHRWAGLRTFDAVAALPAPEAAAGLPFHSVQGTLFHLVLADALWLGRIAGAGAVPEVVPLSLEEAASLWQAERPEIWTEKAPGLDAMREMHDALCTAWDGLLDASTEDSLAAPFRYRNTRGDALEKVLGPVLAHVFNHGTHHRGQVSAALTAAGLPYPVLDLLYFMDAAA
ncbi:hypothetical protein FNF27_01650 [Cafeteria roenbergensis]|uniref:Damage-inducible protein DinB n=1 Tax=Cafeteria roenbergensis TaxID=33653 RepID=A0A5A8EHZ8_CAFRO|nr:hypothetical protein FNF27_01650 [Cafeteria roenbergensis]